MQRWQEQLTKHPLNTVLNRFEEQALRQLDNLDDVAVVERNRFLKVVKLAKRIMNDLDPELAPVDLLNQIHSQLSSHGAISTLEQFAKTSDPGLFSALNEQINPALSYLYQISSLKFARSTRKADIDAASTSFEQFAKKTNENYSKFKQETDTALMSAKQSAEKIESVSVEVTSIGAELNTKIEDWNKTTSSLVNNHKTEFADEKQTRDAKFSKEIDALRERMKIDGTSLIDANNDSFKEKQSSFDDEIERVKKDAQKRHEEIINLHNLVAHDSVTGGYKNIADREYSAAQWWRRG